MTCKECGDDVQRVPTGKTHAKGRKVYQDDTGRQWKGLICPDCRSVSPKEDLIILSDRLCRQCKTRLPKNRYFNCESCLPELGEDDLTADVSRRL